MASNTQDKWNTFMEIYNEGVSRYVPKITINEMKKKEDWYNTRCKLAREKKEAAWNRWRKRGGRKNWEEFKSARNEYVRVLREEERDYEKGVVDKCKNEPKLFYRYVNGKMKNKQSIDRLKVENILYDDAQSQAEIMNTCFQSVFTRETSFEGEGARHKCNGLREFHVDVQEVKEMMKDLDVSKALGPDGVSNWIMKECNEQLAVVIHNIIVCSFKEGKVPLDWKRANIVLIYKGGSKENPLNYRPVSLTSVVAKICERIVKARWMQYLEESNILTGRQFGFRSGRSCVTNLLSFYSRAIDIIQERDGWADCVYLDLKKAFNKVPHQRLQWKIQSVGGL